MSGSFPTVAGRRERSDSAPGILLVGNYPPPFGGIPRHLEDLVPHLVRRGWKVHVLSGPSGTDTYGDGYGIYRAHTRLRRFFDAPAFLARLATRRHARAKLSALSQLSVGERYGLLSRASRATSILETENIRVISGYNLLSGAVLAMTLGEVYEIPVVVTNLGEIYSHADQIQRRRRVIEWIVSRAGALLSPTEHCARSYREIGLSPKVKVIHHGVALDRFAPGVSGAAVRRRAGFSLEQHLVLFIGRLIGDMGLHTLLAAIPSVLEAHPGAGFIIAGGAGDLLPQARAAAARWPDRVSVAVDVPLDELPAYYAAATVVVAPTRGARACGSLAAAEAMATARPVVASAVGGIPEFVTDGETGFLIPAEAPERLATAVIDLLSDADLRTRFGLAGRRRVEQLFNTDSTNDAFERLFRDVAGLS